MPAPSFIQLISIILYKNNQKCIKLFHSWKTSLFLAEILLEKEILNADPHNRRRAAH